MGFGFNFLFNKKKNNEMQEILNEENIFLEGTFDSMGEFVDLPKNDDDIYCKWLSLNPDNSTKLIEELAVRSGIDREKAKEYIEDASFIAPRIYMDKNGNFQFVLEFFGADKEVDLVVTDKEREMLIRKAKEHFFDCFSTDLMKLPEMVKDCQTTKQLYEKFKIEKIKELKRIIEVYNFENMKVQGYSKENLRYNKTVLECTFRPDLKTSMKICKEAGMQEEGIVECTAKFDSHMNMTLEVNGDSEKKTIVPNHSLEKEIRAGISEMYKKYTKEHRTKYKMICSLADYMAQECPELIYEEPSLDDMIYYCKEMRKQSFFNEEMTPDFYNEERLNDWALELLVNYKDYYLDSIEFRYEFDYYKSPHSDTRHNLLKQLRDYKVYYEEELERRKNGFYDNIEIDDEELLF